MPHNPAVAHVLLGQDHVSLALWHKDLPGFQSPRAASRIRGKAERPIQAATSNAAIPHCRNMLRLGQSGNGASNRQLQEFIIMICMPAAPTTLTAIVPSMALPGLAWRVDRGIESVGVRAW